MGVGQRRPPRRTPLRRFDPSRDHQVTGIICVCAQHMHNAGAFSWAEMRETGERLAVMVMGDLNDEVEAATTQILNGGPVQEIATAGFDRPDTGDEERICNLAPRIPAAQRFTRIYRGRKELIDDNFVSHALVGKSRRITSSPTQWVPFHPATTTPRKRGGAPESDRRLVLATIDL
jgi:hypothetical protein